MSSELIVPTEAGLYCAPGAFYIDPWHRVDHAVITHAHSDHARWGSQHYLAAEPGRLLLRARLGESANISTVPYGRAVEINGVQVSFHPAGHVLGSSQVRIEHRGEVWVVSGDYKLEVDSTCATFEPVRCHTFITESTFGLPIYRWDRSEQLFDSINSWWRTNREAGKTSIVYAYSLGKAQRVMAGVDSSIGPMFTHGAVEKITQAYRESGVDLPATVPVNDVPVGRGKPRPWVGGLVIAPPSAAGSPWVKKFEPSSEAIASGWMCARGPRRRSAVDRGFVLSDHTDWPGLLSAVRATGASRVLATHGFASVFARYLNGQGIESRVISTRFGDEEEPSTELSS